jgi:membrane associated rhomboid family serine protease
VELYNKANGVFQDAMRELNTSKGKSANRIESNQVMPPKPNGYFSSISSNRGQPSNEFPISAILVLVGTAMVSIHALRDRRAYDKLILHPWSIMRHGTRKYTIITNGLIHADPMHLGVNMVTFCFFAFLLERIVGHVDFLIIYFGSLFCSSMIVTLTKADDGYYRALGASGAIAGVIFSYILYKPTSTIHFLLAPMGVPAAIFAVFYLAYSWFMTKNKHDHIGHEAHLWGAVSGAVITMVLDPKVLDVLRGHLVI